MEEDHASNYPFLDSDRKTDPEPSFHALGSPGSSTYRGLEVFPNPGCSVVAYVSDEVMCKCPITGQPDFYTVGIHLRSTPYCIESKSLKLFFQNIMAWSFKDEFGMFCESLATYIHEQVSELVNPEGEGDVSVKVVQKSRGGISIEAIV